MGIRSSCPLCHGHSFESAHSRVLDYEHGLPVEVSLSRCTRCGLLVQDPQPSLEALHSYYPDDYRAHNFSGRSVLGWLKSLQARQLIATYGLPADKDQAIADLGCGSGQFVKTLSAAGYRNLVGVDRHPKLARHFAGLPIRFIAAELEPELELQGKFHTIIMNNVLEHFTEPLTVLASCLKRLEPGGRIIVLTPNTDALAHWFFGKYWSGLHAPRHTQIFNRKTLMLAAKKLGFDGASVVPVVDPAGWAFSLQNRVARVGRGTAWYTLASLPLWYPLAFAERILGHAGSLILTLTKEPVSGTRHPNG